MGLGEGEGQGEGQGTGLGAGEGNEWHHGLFGCFGNPKNCLCGTFCGICLLCQNANRAGESGLLYFLLACCAPCIPLLLLKTKLREEHHLEGDTCEDALASWCCPSCVNCQIANELDHRQGRH